MSFSGQLPDWRELLEQHHTHYSQELEQVRKAMRGQSKRLAEIERKLSERREREICRKDKKKLQWSRALTKKAIEDLASQQHWLDDYLRQCYTLLCSYNYNILRPLPASCSYGSAWPATLPSEYLANGEAQYWDLSGLRERRMSSPTASGDSGFYEWSVQSQPSACYEGGDPTRSHACELHADLCSDSSPDKRPSLSAGSSHSERDDVPELTRSPVQIGAEPARPRRRRYSENAIQLLESRLMDGKAHHRRSMDCIWSIARTRSASCFEELRNVEADH
jgi:hypothetical protein